MQELYIWCAIGAVIGTLSGVLMHSDNNTLRIEEVFVGVFGACCAAQVWVKVAQLKEAQEAGGAGMLAATAGAVAGVFILRAFRKFLRSGTASPRRRR